MGRNMLTRLPRWATGKATKETSMTDKYILEGHTPVPCDDLLTWGKWLENREVRRVALTCVGEYKVSTVFLGLDHQYGDGHPLLFETMIFGGSYGREEEYQTRCSTWEEAEQMHVNAVDLVGSMS